jgi:hypothetical protein
MTMKSEKAAYPSGPVAPDRSGDSSKLVSLLALATGAVAMPQTGNADIVFTDMSSNPALVGHSHSSGYTSSFTFTNLPGTANNQIGFKTKTTTSKTATYGARTLLFRTVTVGRQAGSLQLGVQATINGFAVPQADGAAWNNGLNNFFDAKVGRAMFYSQFIHSQKPASDYDPKYLGFIFQDTMHGGALRYGWIKIGLALSPLIGPDVKVYGYAYDDTGAQITMGALPVPEPAPVGLLALGALTWGAKGVRAWRRNRGSSPQA